MGYAALCSGGKDSTLAIWLAERDGLSVDHLITMAPERDDSYMFHHPNTHLMPEIAQSMDKKLTTITTKGEKEGELNDLKNGLMKLDVDGVVSGAVASNYQKTRIDDLCSELDLESVSPLWNMEQKSIIELLIELGFETIIVAVAAYGLDESWLGKHIDRTRLKELEGLEDKYKINVAGEGGEYESFTLNCPSYKWGFKVAEAEKKWDGHRGTYEIKKLKKIENKV
ncbi:MAG: diphthine--ammonia ligase [Thermoplasmata archaeon]